MAKKIFAAAVAAGCSMVTAVHAADTAVTESTSVGGRIFADFTNLEVKTGATKTAASGTGIDVTRAYLILNHTFDSIWSANLTTDFNYISADSETQLFVKKAYIQAKLSDAFWVRVGSADLAWVPFVEDQYGYRYVEKVLIDRTSFGTSADWGLHVGGKLGDGGMFGYAVSAVEGNGYKNPTRSKSLDVDARISITPVTGLTAAVGLYSGKRGKDVEAPVSAALHTADRYTGLVSYSNDKFRVGAEYFKADNWNNVTTVPTDSADGFSAWASVNFTKQVSGFVRYDSDKPNKDTASTRKEDYYNVGVSFKPRKGVDVAFAYKHDELDNATATTDNKSDEVGVWGAVNF